MRLRQSSHGKGYQESHNQRRHEGIHHLHIDVQPNKIRPHLDQHDTCHDARGADAIEPARLQWPLFERMAATMPAPMPNTRLPTAVPRNGRQRAAHIPG